MSNDGIESDDLWAQTTAIPVTPPPSGTPTRQHVAGVVGRGERQARAGRAGRPRVGQRR